MKPIQVIPPLDEKSLPIVDQFFYGEIEREFGIAETALKERIKAANITPHRDGKTPFVDLGQMLVLRQQHEYLAGGKSRTLKSYRETYISPNTEKNKLVSIGDTTAIDKYETDFPAILNMEIVRRNALDAIATNERIQAYAQFEIYARSGESMTDREIEELIGFKPPRTNYKYDRYKFIRYGKIHVLDKSNVGKLKKMSTWLIEKFDPLEQRSSTKQKAEEEAAIQTYIQVKEAFIDDD